MMEAENETSHEVKVSPNCLNTVRLTMNASKLFHHIKITHHFNITTTEFAYIYFIYFPILVFIDSMFILYVCFLFSIF